MLPVVKWYNSLPKTVDEFFGRDFMSDILGEKTGISVPVVNIKEGKDDFKIEVVAPGLEKKDFQIDLDQNVLTIRSQKEENLEEKDSTYMRREFSYSSFSRSFTLPEMVKAEDIKASHKDGVLYITIPKKEEAKLKAPKQIKIS
ncbi:MAG: Hsp20/alpha crystallin family protein [Bacteroidetes bacterium]|nr:Hsp20/alpha crystallin family protein [Bacteroidota bacterium]